MRLRESAVLLFAIAAGIAFAWVDARPHWDDSGVLAAAMIVSGGICGLVAPRFPWLWGLSLGIWIPAHAIARTPAPASAAIVVVVAFPLAGAWAGALLRRAAAARD